MPRGSAHGGQDDANAEDRAQAPGANVPGDEEATVDSVPAAVRHAALRAFHARRPGTRVADLIFDSLLNDNRRMQPAQTRRLRFGEPTWGAEVAVTEGPTGLRLEVRVGPPRAAHVELRLADQSFHFESDDTGGLVVEGVRPERLMSLVVTFPVEAHEQPFQTAWVRL